MPKQYTAQQIFDRVAKHLLKQGMPARNYYALNDKFDGGTCQYRKVYRGRVLKCAVGCLIPKSKYVSIMEGQSAEAVLEDHHMPALSVHTKLLMQLQGVHDWAEHWHNKEIVSRLRAVAYDHKLSDAVLPEDGVM